MHRDDRASSRQRSRRTSLGSREGTREAGRAGHPLYRPVIALAIALFVMALGFELAHVGSPRELYYLLALIANIGGVLLSLGAAILGAIRRDALPPTDEAQSLAIQQVLFHALAILMFGAGTAHLHRGWTERSLVPPDTLAALAFGMLGLVAIAIAVALGWALAHTASDDPRRLRPRLLRRRPRPSGFGVPPLRDARAAFP